MEAYRINGVCQFLLFNLFLPKNRYASNALGRAGCSQPTATANFVSVDADSDGDFRCGDGGCPLG